MKKYICKYTCSLYSKLVYNSNQLVVSINSCVKVTRFAIILYYHVRLLPRPPAGVVDDTAFLQLPLGALKY